MIRIQITYITKDHSLAACLEAHKISTTIRNTESGFRATGLTPYKLELVLKCLDQQPMTLSPPTSRQGTAKSWVTKTLQISYEMVQQSTTIKSKIAVTDRGTEAMGIQIDDGSLFSFYEELNLSKSKGSVFIHGTV